MSNDEDDLPFGLYERLVTAGLKARLLRFDSRTARIAKKELDPAEAHATLARHIANVVARALNALPREDRAATQSDLTNQIIRLLSANPADAGSHDELVEIPAEELCAIQPIGKTPNEDRDVVAPLVALSASDLLVNARGEPGLAHALVHEIPSSDSIDLLCAFVRWHGLRLLADQIEAHCRAGRPLRVITTVFTGSTERKALDWLVARGAQVKVSYDTQVHAPPCDHRDDANRSQEAGATGFSVPACGLLDAAGSCRDSDRPRQPEERHSLASSCDGEELMALAGARSASGRRITLPDFLQEAGLELEDVYRSGSWSGLQRDARLEVPAPGPYETLIGDRLAGLLHVDDPLRLEAYERLAASASVIQRTDADRRLVTGFHFAAIPSKIAPKTLAESVALLHAHPAIVEELRELLPLLDERSEHLTYPLDLARPTGSPLRVPLSVHARHTVDDVLTAFGMLDFNKTAWKQTGVIRDEQTNSDLFFVTLEKSEREYSPSTLYKDYAISPALFHCESQSTTTQRSKTGQRYIHHRNRGGHILLFVRPRKKLDGRTMPYTFIGPADYVSHKGDRPISFVWKLQRPMPADFFRRRRWPAANSLQPHPAPSDVPSRSFPRREPRLGSGPGWHGRDNTI